MSQDCRYVVLHHTGHGPSHYDFMLDAAVDRPLLTWRLMAWPDFTAAEPIGPHRRDFLTYEGDLTGGRGRVDRVASGACRLLERSGAGVVLEIDGRHILLPFSD